MYLYGHPFQIKTGVMGSTRELEIMFFTGCSLLVGQWIESGYKHVTRVLEGVGRYLVSSSPPE